MEALRNKKPKTSSLPNMESNQQLLADIKKHEALARESASLPERKQVVSASKSQVSMATKKQNQEPDLEPYYDFYEGKKFSKTKNESKRLEQELWQEDRIDYMSRGQTLMEESDPDDPDDIIGDDQVDIF